MATVSVLSMLESLADAQEKRNELAADIDRQISELRGIQAAKCSEVDQKIESLTKGIKNSVLLLGESAKGSRLHAVYAKGRVTWDGKLLQGYAAAHPEIEAFKKIGEPSVSIRASK